MAKRVLLLTQNQINFKSTVEDGRFPILVSALTNGQLVPYYLMASFLYYTLDLSLFSDTEYDKLCVRLENDWDEIQHGHKHLIDFNALSATTGYYIKEYPLIVQHSAMLLYKVRNETSNTRHKKLSFF